MPVSSVGSQVTKDVSRPEGVCSVESDQCHLQIETQQH